MIHKQEELEQLELEQALAMSLLAEGERLRMARVEAKSRPDDDGDDDKGMPHECDAKPSRSGDTSADKTRKGSPPPEHVEEGGGGDPKPIRAGPGGLSLSPLKALPPIGAGKKPSLTELSTNYRGMGVVCVCSVRR